MNDARAIDPEQLNRRVLAEQVALMCRLTTSPLFGSVIVGAMMAYLTTEDAGAAVSVAWYLSLLAVTLTRWRVARAYLTRSWEHTEVRRWRVIMLTLAAVAGAVWSIPGAILLPANPTKEIVMSVLFIGATASGQGSQSPVRHGYAALLITFIAPYAVNQFLMGGERIVIGLAFLLYMPVMIVIANRQTASVERQIRLAIENEALADELRLERDRLESQATELRTANNDLEGFSYSVSHDLRAPLRAIDGFSRLLQDKESPPDAAQSQHYLNRIRENITRMSALIDDLLAFSRCGRQPVDLGELRMEDLARKAANEARNAHPTPAATIDIESLPRARGDQRLLLQVWVNLLDNAVKYSSKVPEPHITVRGRTESGRVVYEVTDNGVGFDSSHAGKLFGVFQRLHGISEYPGTGVGLAIVKRIVTRHGGEVWARAELNQGATFGFALPLAKN